MMIWEVKIKLNLYKTKFWARRTKECKCLRRPDSRKKILRGFCWMNEARLVSKCWLMNFQMSNNESPTFVDTFSSKLSTCFHFVYLEKSLYFYFSTDKILVLFQYCVAHVTKGFPLYFTNYGQILENLTILTPIFRNFDCFMITVTHRPKHYN